MTQGNCIKTVLELVRIVWHKVIGNFHFCKHYNESHKQYNADHMHTHRYTQNLQFITIYILVRPVQNARPILLQENLTELNNRQLLICSYLYTIIAMYVGK